MKKTILILIAAALLASCDNWLAEKPESFIGPDQIEDSESGVDVWVSGVYANYLDDMFRWAWFPFVLELDCDYISGPEWFLGTTGLLPRPPPWRPRADPLPDTPSGCRAHR